MSYQANYRKSRRRIDPEYAERLRQHVRNCRSRKNPNAKKRRSLVGLSSSEMNRLHRYGVSVEEFTVLMEKQDGKCPVCKTDITGPKAAHVDHDHDTKKVRGLLCARCNRGIGLLRDAVDVLKAAIDYLSNGVE